MRRLVLLLVFCIACDKDQGAAADPDSKLLGERLIAAHGEAFLAQPVLIVYDSGFIVGRGSLDPEFSTKVEALNLRPANALSAGLAPIPTSQYLSQEGVELGVDFGEKTVVADSTSSLTLRLVFGKEALDALRTCEAVRLDRVCRVDGELRARLDDISPGGATLLEHGRELARAEIKGGWAVFAGAPELGDDAQLELVMSDGVHCNLSKWLVDPRDSCAM